MLVGTEDQAEVREGDRVIEARWFKGSRGGEIYQLESDEVYTLQTQSLRAQVSLAQMESRNQRSAWLPQCSPYLCLLQIISRRTAHNNANIVAI